MPWDIRYLLGTIDSRLKTLENRTSEDREIAAQRHADNQEAMAEIRAGTQSSLAELRQTTQTAVNEVKQVIRKNGSSDTSRKAALYVIGVAALGVVIWIVQEVLGNLTSWLLSHFKF